MTDPIICSQLALVFVALLEQHAFGLRIPVGIQLNVLPLAMISFDWPAQNRRLLLLDGT